MTSTHTPAREVSDALVALFRNDPVWSDDGGLLFPAWSPRVTGEDADKDLRVYSNHAELPKVPAVLSVLPRLLFDVNWRMHTYEQEQPGTLHGPVSAWLHVVTPRDREEYGDRLLAAAMLTIVSTRLSSARIIAGELTVSADVSKDRISQFNGAWEWLVGFRSPNVGVLI